MSDIVLPDSGGDGISALVFSSVADHLAAACWDGGVRLFNLQASQTSSEWSSSVGHWHDGPALDLCWSIDGAQLFSCGADSAVRVLDLGSGATSRVGQHEAAIRRVKWTPAHGGLLVTGGWDASLKLWDLRSPVPAFETALSERCYGLDTSNNLLVAATADRRIQTFDLEKLDKRPISEIESPLKYQTRVVACFPQSDAFAVGSIEGRVAIHYFDELRGSKENFSFKCHRRNEETAGTFAASRVPTICSVNAIAFHHLHGTFVTGGSDGTLSMWDKAHKTRLKTLAALPPGTIASESYSITAAAFSKGSGKTLLAYAHGYDWTEGYKLAHKTAAARVAVHICEDDEIMPRSRT